MKISTEPVYVGCEVFVRKGNGILLGLRKNKFGAGTWGLPGGHLEYNERLIDAARRELKEEVGISAAPNDLKLVCITESLATGEGGNHHVHISFELQGSQQEPQLMEPNECEEWCYFDLAGLPDNVFPPHHAIIENYVQHRLYAY